MTQNILIKNNRNYFYKKETEMNSTINQTRMNNSRPSFNGFSQKAQQYVSEQNISKLIEKGKISLGDFAYLKAHKLEIDVIQGDSRGIIEGKGLHIRNPYSGSTAEASEANYNNSPIDIKLTPIKEKFISCEFKNIEETLGDALKKAVKFFKRFDKIDLEKANYYEENGKVIDNLKMNRAIAYSMHQDLLRDVFTNDRAATRYYSKNDSYEPVAKLDKKLSRFHNDEYFENKQKKLFSKWVS